MKVNKTILGLAIALSIPHSPARATTPKEFLISNAQDLTAVCSTQSSDPLYTAGINFCISGTGWPKCITSIGTRQREDRCVWSG
jgi:hypothetical protein